ILMGIFMGVCSFLRAYGGSRHIEPRRPGDEVRTGEIWERFPKFIMGFAATFLIVLLIGFNASPALLKILNASMDQANVFRQLFFLLTFITIGLMSDVRALWREGIAQPAPRHVGSVF